MVHSMAKLIKGVKQLIIVWETLTSNDKASLCGLRGSSAGPVEKALAGFSVGDAFKLRGQCG